MSLHQATGGSSGPLPSVSVVVATYNRGQLLVRTLEQILANDHPDFEVIVVDQTPDQPAVVAASLDQLSRDHSRIRRVVLQAPSLTVARNVGLDASAKEIVVFCDDDLDLGVDLLSRHALNYLDPSIGAVGGRVLGQGSVAQAMEGTTEVGALRPDGSFIANFHRAGRRDVDFGMGCNMSFRRTALLTAGGFDERFTGGFYREEGDAFARVKSLGCRVVFDDRAVVHHLTEAQGGCRKDELLPRMHSTFRNETLFYCKNLSMRAGGRFLGRIVRWMYATTKTNELSPYDLVYFLTALPRGVWACYFQRPDYVTGRLSSGHSRGPA